MLSKNFSRWSGLAALFAPLLLLSFGSHTFWRYLHRIRYTFGIADGDHIHPIIAAAGLVATMLVFIGLYQQLPLRARPASTWLLRASMLGGLLGLVGLRGFFYPAPSWGFAPLGAGVLLLLIALGGICYLTVRHGTFGIFGLVPLALAISGFGIVFTQDYAPGGTDRPMTQVFIILYIVCWLLLGVLLLTSREVHSSQRLST